MTNTNQSAIEALVGRLESAWNSADAEAFASEFTHDADFVNIRGDYSSGREPIARGHAHIWSSVYAGSSLRYTLVRLRSLSPDVLLAHLDATLHVPAGPVAGDTRAIPSIVLVREGDAWRIASFHNTTRQGG